MSHAPDQRLAVAGLRRGPFRQPGYTNYVVAMLFGATGFWMSRIAQDWLVLELTHNVVDVGIAASLQFAPLLVLGLYGGVLADRFDVKKLLVIAQSLVGLSAAAVAFLTLTGTVQVWHVFLAAGITGLAGVLEQPSRASIVGRLSGAYLRGALSLNMLAFQVAGLIGPTLATLVIAQWGIGWVFWSNTIGCLITIALILPVGLRRQVPRTPGATGIRQGLAVVVQRPEIGRAMVLATIFAVLTLAMPLMYAAFAQREFGAGVAGYSLLNAVNAAGAAAGALLNARRTGVTRLRTLAALLATVGAILALAAWSPALWVLAPLVALQAAVSATFSLGAASLVQTRTPALALGRVMSLYSLIVLGGQSLANPFVGAAIDAAGVRPVLFTCGTLTVVACLVTARSLARAANVHLHLPARWATSRPAS